LGWTSFGWGQGDPIDKRTWVIGLLAVDASVAGGTGRSWPLRQDGFETVGAFRFEIEITFEELLQSVKELPLVALDSLARSQASRC